MKARGNTKLILKKVSEIQKLIGNAKSLHDNDRDTDAHSLAQKQLEEAFKLCVEIRGMYDAI